MPVCVFSNGDRQGVDLDGKGVGRNREEQGEGKPSSARLYEEKQSIKRKKDMQRWTLYIIQTTYLFATSSTLPRLFNFPDTILQWHIFTITLYPLVRVLFAFRT